MQRLSILVLNQTWFVEELRQLGHAVVSAGWDDKGLDVRFRIPGIELQELLAMLPSGFIPDRILYLDDSGPPSVRGLSETTIPVLFYSVDSHHHSWWHAPFSGVFDKTLIAQKIYLENFQEFGPVSWLPLWAPVSTEESPHRDIEVCFRGNLDPYLHPKRAAFFKRLGELTSLDAKTGQYLEAFQRAKIVVNQSVKDDLNFRVFETMMCGALLITPKANNGLLELFQDGVHVVTYEDDDAEDAAQKCNYYLQHEAERRTIAEAGRAQILTSHTKAARAKMIETELLDLAHRNKPMRFFAEGYALYSGSNTMRRVSDKLGDEMRRDATKLFIRSAEAGELSSNIFMVAVHFCKYEFEDAGRAEDAVALIKAIYEAYPENTMLGVSYVESLLRSDRGAEAARVAQAIDPQKATIIVSQAEKTLEPFRKEVYAQLDRIRTKRAERMESLNIALG